MNKLIVYNHLQQAVIKLHIYVATQAVHNK